MRPGRIMLTVTPSAATSFDSDFDQPTSAERIAFERPRFGIGWITPDEPTVTIRPQPRSRIPGSSAWAMPMTRSTIMSNCFASTSRSASTMRPGGGPPVLATRMSTPPIASFAAFARSSTERGVHQVGGDEARLAAAARVDRVGVGLQVVLGPAGQQDVRALPPPAPRRCRGRCRATTTSPARACPSVPGPSGNLPQSFFEPRDQSRQLLVVGCVSSRVRASGPWRTRWRPAAAASPCGWRAPGRAAARTGRAAGRRRRCRRPGRAHPSG